MRAWRRMGRGLISIDLLYAPLTIPLRYCHVISMASYEHRVRRGHHKEAKRCQSCGHRIRRNDETMVSLLLLCATTWLSLIAGWC